MYRKIAGQFTFEFAPVFLFFEVYKQLTAIKEKLKRTKTKGVSVNMADRKLPHEQLTTKDNGLTSMQEVLYRKEFKRADKTAEKNKQHKK